MFEQMVQLVEIGAMFKQMVFWNLAQYHIYTGLIAKLKYTLYADIYTIVIASQF